MKLQIYEKTTNKVINIKTDPRFEQYRKYGEIEVYVNLNGVIILEDCGEFITHLNDNLFDVRPQFEIYNKLTNKTINPKTEECFNGFDLFIDLDGNIEISESGKGSIIARANKNYGTRKRVKDDKNNE